MTRFNGGVSRRALTVVACCAAFAVGACGSADGVETVETDPTPVATIGGVGSLPDTVPRTRQPLIRIPTLVEADGSVATLIGERVDGTRVLLIGDSIFTGASSRYGNEFCEQLTPLGWDVAVEAEPSRFVEFGPRVLDRVLPAPDVQPEDDWSAAVVFLGSNYRGDPFAYEVDLREVLDRLSPRPVVVLTVSEYRPEWSEVNEVINRIDPEYDNVVVVDWKSISEAPGVLSGDRLHPTNEGRRVLAEVVAAALGPVSMETGDCLRSVFRDDSAAVAGSLGGSSSSRGSSGGGSSSLSGSSGGSSSSGGGSSSGGSTVTAPPATAPPDTGDGTGGDAGDTGGDGGGDAGGTDGGDGGGSTDGSDSGGSSGGSDGGGDDGGSSGGGDSGGSSGGSSDSGGGTSGGDGSGSVDGGSGGGDSGAGGAPPPGSAP